MLEKSNPGDGYQQYFKAFKEARTEASVRSAHLRNEIQSAEN